MHRPKWMRSKRGQSASRRQDASPSRPADSSTLIPSAESSNTAREETSSAIPDSSRTLWNEAYDKLRGKEPSLVEKFEDLLLAEPEITRTGPGDGHSLEREQQLQQFISRKLAEKKPVTVKFGDKSIEVREQFDHIIARLSVLKPLGNSLAAIDPVHAGLPWAGVCLLLSLLANDSKQRTIVTDGLEEIEILILCYSPIERVYLHGDSRLIKVLRTNLIQLFTGILEFQVCVARHHSYNEATQTALNTVKSVDWNALLISIRCSKMKCDAIIRQLDLEDDRHRAGEWTAILDHQQEQIKEWYKALQKQNEEIVSELKTSRIEQKTREQIKEERECHQMFRNSEYEAYKNRNPDRVADTCLWFLGHANYKGWLENQTSGLLWITADPGCGKSVLSKSLVDNELRSNDVRTTCYFFFKDNPEQSSVTKAVCALLHQLFLQKSSLIRHAIPIYSHNGSQLPELFDLLWEILKQATADPEAGEVVCVVDALDECEESGRRRFIRALNSLYWDYTGEATSLRVKFLVTSRPYIDIEFDFQNLTERTPTIRLEGEEETEKISQEINLVIKDSVRKISHRLLLEESVSSSLEKTLLNTSQRTYLWLYLVLETFEEQGLTQAEVQDLIRTLPKSVYDAYQSILNKIKPHKKQLAKRLLQIVLVAAKPLTLQEMNVALGLKEGDKSQVSLPNQDAFKKRVRSLCGLFVSVVDKKLYLIHQTAKEYLIAENESQTEHGLWQHSLTPREAHLVLAKICINYLLFSTFEHHPLLLDDDQDSHTYNSRISQYLAEHDFLQYAALHWSAHFREADIHDPAVLNMVLNIVDTQSKRFRTWFRVYLDLNGEVFNIFSPGTHELIVESYFGHTTIVSMLLTRSDVSPDYKDPNGRTALWWAADRGHTEVVKLLLARPEVDINSKDRGGDTPLTRAALEGHEAMTKLLLAHPRIDADVKGTWNRTPLYCAARQGHPGVVAQLLARPEVDPDVKDNDGLTPLANAAASGNEAITALLLMRPEVNADETDAIGRTPLYWAAVHGKEKVVALLLARPEVHPGVANWKGKTPLSAAMENGQMATAAMISSALKAHRNS